MSLSLQLNPDKNVNGVQSNVNAAITQLPYTFKREDDSFTGLASSGGGANISITIADTTGMTVGDSVFFFDDAEVFGAQIATIFAVPTGTTVQLVIPYQVGSTTGYINRITERSDYSVQINIISLDAEVIAPASTFVYKPSQSGDLFIDIGAIITSMIENAIANHVNYRIEYRENYTGIDLSFTADVTINGILGERSIGQLGGTNAAIVLLRPENNRTLTTFAESNGGNLRVFTTENINITAYFTVGSYVELINPSPYLPGIYRVLDTAFTGSSTSVTLALAFITQFDPQQARIRTDPKTPRGKILTFFGEPKKWVGWFQTAAVIMDTNYTLNSGFASAEWMYQSRDINNVIIGEAQAVAFGTLENRFYTLEIPDLLEEGGTTWVHTGTLDNGGFDQIVVTGLPAVLADFVVGQQVSYIGSMITTKRVGIVTAVDLLVTNVGVTVDHVYDINIGSGNLTEATVDHVRVEVRNAGLVTRVSEFLPWKYENQCANPIMITWINSAAVAEYYLFDISQEARLGVTGILTYDPATEGDVQDLHRQTVSINADETLRLICTAENLTQADIRALHQIKTSEAVQVFLTKDGLERVGVIVSSALETAYATEDKNGAFTVAIDFPEDYNFFSVKSY